MSAFFSSSIIGGQIAQGVNSVSPIFLPAWPYAFPSSTAGWILRCCPRQRRTCRNSPSTLRNDSASCSKLANPITTWMMAKYPPLTLINPLYAGQLIAFSCLVLVCCWGDFDRGYCADRRFLICNWTRKGVIDSLKVLLLGGVALLTITGLSYAVHLPIPIQRSLSFFGWLRDKKRSPMRGIPRSGESTCGS